MYCLRVLSTDVILQLRSICHRSLICIPHVPSIYILVSGLTDQPLPPYLLLVTFPYHLLSYFFTKDRGGATTSFNSIQSQVILNHDLWVWLRIEVEIRLTQEIFEIFVLRGGCCKSLMWSIKIAGRSNNTSPGFQVELVVLGALDVGWMSLCPDAHSTNSTQLGIVSNIYLLRLARLHVPDDSFEL